MNAEPGTPLEKVPDTIPPPHFPPIPPWSAELPWEPRRHMPDISSLAFQFPHDAVADTPQHQLSPPISIGAGSAESLVLGLCGFSVGHVCGRVLTRIGLFKANTSCRHRLHTPQRKSRRVPKPGTLRYPLPATNLGEGPWESRPNDVLQIRGCGAPQCARMWLLPWRSPGGPVWLLW